MELSLDTNRGKKLYFMLNRDGLVAQLEERYNRTVEVKGSNPFKSTINIKCYEYIFPIALAKQYAQLFRL